MAPDDPPTPTQPVLWSPVRELDLRRDALVGPPADQERHRLARLALLDILFGRMHAYWRGWCEQSHLGALNAQAIADYEALAAAEGLPRRAALWNTGGHAHERRDAIFATWAEAVEPLLDAPDPANRNMVNWAATHYAATAFAKPLRVPLPWLSLELQSMFTPVLVSYITDRPVVLELERGVQDQVLRLRLEPGESEAAFLVRTRSERLRALAAPAAPGPRRRLPKDAAYIRQSVEWLVRHRLDGVSIGQLAREYVATKPDGLRGDGRSHVRGGIARAHEWLNAVPSSPGPG